MREIVEFDGHDDGNDDGEASPPRNERAARRARRGPTALRGKIARRQQRRR